MSSDLETRYRAYLDVNGRRLDDLVHFVQDRLTYDDGLMTAATTGTEHVFYRFEDGRIAVVSSLIDRRAIADQLGVRGGP